MTTDYRHSYNVSRADALKNRQNLLDIIASPGKQKRHLKDAEACVERTIRALELKDMSTVALTYRDDGSMTLVEKIGHAKVTHSYSEPLWSGIAIRLFLLQSTCYHSTATSTCYNT